MPPIAAAKSRREPPEPMSAVLRDLCELSDDHALTVGEIVQRFGRRAFGALLFIFAIPNALPLPPGSSSILGLPLVLLAPQVMMGFRRPWLPKFIYNRHVKPSDMEKLFSKIIPRLEQVERVSGPRLTILFGPIGDRIIGLICSLMAVVLIFPIWLGNLAPALCVGVLGLALFQRDGYLAMVGYVAFVVSVGLLVVAYGTIVLMVQKAITMLGM